MLREYLATVPGQLLLRRVAAGTEPFLIIGRHRRRIGLLAVFLYPEASSR